MFHFCVAAIVLVSGLLHVEAGQFTLTNPDALVVYSGCRVPIIRKYYGVYDDRTRSELR